MILMQLVPGSGSPWRITRTRSGGWLGTSNIKAGADFQKVFTVVVVAIEDCTFK